MILLYTHFYLPKDFSDTGELIFHSIFIIYEPAAFCTWTAASTKALYLQTKIALSLHIP